MKFIDEWQKRRNKYPLQFNFWFAKICAEKNIEKNKGKMAIKYCIDNYNSSILQIETLKKLEVLLNK